MSTNGLIHALAIDGHGGAADAGWEDVRASQRNDGVLWIHLDRSEEQAARWLREDSGLNELTCTSLLSSSTRPRCLATEHGLLLVLRGVNLNPGADPEDMVSLRVWLEPNRIITLRRERLMAIEDIASDLRMGRGPRNTGEFTARVAHRLTERMGPTVEHTGDLIDELEDQIVDPSQVSSRSSLIALRRSVIALHRFLAPQRAALADLQAIETALLDDDHRAALCEVTNRVTRYVEDLHSARERAIVLHDEITTQMTEQLNSRMYLLTVIAAIVLPLSLVTGLLGINVGGIPLAESPWGFAIVTAALAGLGVVLVAVFRRLNWL